MAKKTATKDEIDIIRIEQGVVRFNVLGEKGLIFNRMSEKVRYGLLLPKKKTMAERSMSLKHDPLAEYRASAYLARDPRSPTALQFIAAAFKKSMASAATDMPGAARSQIGRLAWAKGERVAIYGVPQLLMSITRSGDMARTPDIRTRMIVPRWACQVEISFSSPILNETTIANLMAAAGMIRGVGDWRAEKGSDSYGSFRLVDEGDKEWASIVKLGGRAAPLAAIETPDFYDDESRDLYSWWTSEVSARGQDRLRSGNGKPEDDDDDEIADAD